MLNASVTQEASRGGLTPEKLFGQMKPIASSFEYDHAQKPTIDSVLQRVHPEDRADFHKIIDSVAVGSAHFEHTYRYCCLTGK